MLENLSGGDYEECLIAKFVNKNKTNCFFM